MQYQVTLVRCNGKRTNDEKIRQQIDYLISRGLNGPRGKGWEVQSREYDEPVRQPDNLVRFRCTLTFAKTKGSRGGETEYRQWEQIIAMMTQCGEGAKFGDYPWKVSKQGTDAPESNNDASKDKEGEGSSKDSSKTCIPDVRTVGPTGKPRKWEELQIPYELIDRHTSDAAISKHNCFNHIYARGAQIRTALANIKAAIDSKGERRYHSVFWGPSGCGKTTILLALEQLLGPGSVLRLDATSTTRAGLEKMFFSDLKEIPPLVFMEEIEKAPEDALKIWLGALDDRGEIRKVNFRQTQVRQIRILFFCTCNDKQKFDRMAGADGQIGALSSRCVSEIYCPLPGDATLRKILDREIREKGGKEEWVGPAVELAAKMKQRDPRRVQSYLAGGDRLLDQSYQKDIILMGQQAKGGEEDGEEDASESFPSS